MIVGLKIISIMILVLVTFVVFLAILKGSGKRITLLDENGNSYENGISVREEININDSKQYVFITGEDKDKPVLLFLHGGPGSPEVGLFNFEAGNRLEEEFVVCYWEQRGAGLSYGARLPSEEMTLAVMVEDTIAITEYLLERFGQEKIYIMGHSWGSFLGVKVIQAKPEYYKAYFGIGQVVDQTRSEKLAYEYMISHADEINDFKAIKELEKFNIDDQSFPTPKYLMSARTKYMNKYGIGIMHEENYKMSSMIKDIFWFEGYSAFDFLTFGLGSMSSTESMTDLFTKENLMNTETNFTVPIYILHGKYDYQVSYEVAQQYAELINAPEKEFYSFEHSAHSPIFEETEKFLEIVFSILEKYQN